MYRIGVDLGGTNIAAGIIGNDLTLINKGSVPTALPRSAEEICHDIAELIKKLTADASLSFENDIEGIGIGSPGIISRGTVIRADNLGFNNVPLAKMLSDITGKEVFLRNDGNAAAYGELVSGSGKGCRSLVAVTLGTGVGGGIVIDGKIVEGCGGSGGEVGHFITNSGGKKCACGNYGCFEAYCSATALIKETVSEMEKHPESRLWELAGSADKVNGKTAFDGMRLGDETASKIVDGYIYQLAVGVSGLINLLQPEVVCIGGGICKEGETLLAPLRKYVSKMIFAFDGEGTKIVTAVLGNDAGIIGAGIK